MNDKDFWQRFDRNFWAKVRKTKTCWLWPKRKLLRYGQISIRGKCRVAHRYAYESVKGKIPEGLQIDHLCKNTFCVNPDHLEAVTPWENQLRSTSPTAINSRRTRCKRGHKFSKNNTVTARDGHRACIECGRIRAREHWRKKNPGFKARAH